MSHCLPCAAGFEFECWFPKTVGETNVPCRNGNVASSVGNSSSDFDPVGFELDETERSTRAGKNDRDLKDVKSTGRKRAALLAPFLPGMICEWSGLKFAGGGVKPIIGCRDNPATARHHGPDKDTLNNALGTNLHRICAICHNRWHSRNDSFYGDRREPGDPFVPLEHPMLPHDPDTKATDREFVEAELEWKVNPAIRVGAD